MSAHVEDRKEEMEMNDPGKFYEEELNDDYAGNKRELHFSSNQ